jgi:hypothetical protein
MNNDYYSSVREELSISASADLARSGWTKQVSASSDISTSLSPHCLHSFLVSDGTHSSESRLNFKSCKSGTSLLPPVAIDLQESDWTKEKGRKDGTGPASYHIRKDVRPRTEKPTDQ